MIPTDDMITVLLVDDHAVVRQGLYAFLDAQEGIQVTGEAENGLQIHLVEFPGGGPDSNHMAFRVDDIDTAIDALRAKGLDVGAWNDIGTGRQVFLRDPSGNIVELNQPT